MSNFKCEWGGGGGKGEEGQVYQMNIPPPPNNALSNPQCDGCIEQF